MRYMSVFSGIEAASLAFRPLGWEPLAFSEIAPFPCAVLEERFPGVPNLGDMTEIDWKKVIRKHGKPDLVVGGSPCQSFSVAGKREGLKGQSGLMYEFVRCVREARPRWFLWENVPGALNVEHGAAFGQLLGEMADGGGYGLAWRVLDAQFFGVPQRRRRLFLVGRAGNGFREACSVLFERDCMPGNTTESRAKREALAEAAGRSPRSAGFCNAAVKAGGIGYEPEQHMTLRAGSNLASIGAVLDARRSWAVRTAQTGANGIGVVEESAHTVDASGPEAVAIAANQLTTGPDRQRRHSVARRLTPRECERLMGMPDDWTRVPYRGRPTEKCPDGPRYKAIGNSMAVPVMRWIGERMQMVDGGGRIS